MGKAIYTLLAHQPSLSGQKTAQILAIHHYITFTVSWTWKLLSSSLIQMSRSSLSWSKYSQTRSHNKKTCFMTSGAGSWYFSLWKLPRNYFAYSVLGACNCTKSPYVPLHQGIYRIHEDPIMQCSKYKISQKKERKKFDIYTALLLTHTNHTYT